MVDTTALATALAQASALDPNRALIGVAVVAVAAAAAVLLVTWLRTKPPRPPVGPQAMDGGNEPPAIVDLVTGGFRVEDDAVPATVVDLAARRAIDIEEVAGGNVVIRIRRKRPGDLTAYEERVMRHIERKAVDGIAPAAALTLGQAGVSRRWWKGFVREVNRHGRELGLCRRRWTFAHLAIIWLPIVVAGALVVVTASTADRIETAGGWGEPEPLALALATLGILGVGYMARRVTFSDAQAATPQGLDVASRWLGAREFLSGTGSFDEAPAASVAIWERQLGYATALGLAPVVQRQLPFETEHDRHAWSRASGHWRRVRIRYVSLRPGWGMSPWAAAFGGLVQTAVLGAAAWVGLQLAREAFDVGSFPERAQEWLPVVGLAVAALAVAGAAWTATKALLGISDLFSRTSIEGELVRRRRFAEGHRLPRVVQWMLWSGHTSSGTRKNQNRSVKYHVAIDDGTDDRLVARRVRPQLYGAVRQGATVRATVTPRLGYVTELVELAPPPATEAGVAHEPTESAGTGAAALAESMLGMLGDRLDAIGTGSDAHASVLDTVDDDGVTARERLAQAQRELQRMSSQGTLGGPRDSTGQPLLGGLIDRVSGAVDRLSDTAPPPGADNRPDPAEQ